MNYENIFKREEKTLEQQRQDKLKQYGLDEESIKEFRSKIKVVSYDESNTLGFNLSNELLNKTKNKDKILEYILNGANVNYKKEECSLLEIAINNKDLETAFLLIRAGSRYDAVSINTTKLFLYGQNLYIYECIENDMPELLEILILLGCDCNKNNPILDRRPIDYARRKYSKFKEANIINEKLSECVKILEKYSEPKVEEIDYVGKILKEIINKKEKTNKEVLQDCIKDMEQALEDCEKLLGEDYQKKLIK